MPEPIIIISAMTAEKVIGFEGSMPWSVPAEYQQYLSFIAGQTVIMGRRSYEIFGEDLTSAHTLVLSRKQEDGEAYTVCPDLGTALEKGQSFGKKIFVAGGGMVYRQAEPLADEMYLSIIRGDFPGDTYFPVFKAKDWGLKTEREEPEFIFRHYVRPA